MTEVYLSKESMAAVYHATRTALDARGLPVHIPTLKNASLEVLSFDVPDWGVRFIDSRMCR